MAGDRVMEEIDLGHGHVIRFADWDPDLDLNPGLRDIADQLPARVSGIVRHQVPDVNSGTQGGYCEGVITFDPPITRAHLTGPYWTVESWDPLTLSPSLLCHCGDHGHIREGRWVPA
jgi:hypothetical protein